MFDLGKIYQDQLQEAKNSSKKKYGHDDLDYSFLIDGLEDEREQDITIDVAYRYFATDKTKFIIADSPGHHEYTRNMAVAASNSDVALILIDASKSITEQTIRHSKIIQLMGIKRMLIVINKMDKVNYDEKIFIKIKREYLKILNLKKIAIDFIPISAITGENIVTKSANMTWYQDPTIMEYLENYSDAKHPSNNFRFTVQNVIRNQKGNRGYQGIISSGNIQIGEEIYIPHKNHTAFITEIIHSAKQVEQASDTNSVTFFLDRELDISRGVVFTKKKKK